MSGFERFSCALGALLLGFAATMVLRRQQATAGGRRRTAAPVEQLVQPLQEAWSAYHNR